MNLLKTGNIPLGKLRNILQYVTDVLRDDGAIPCTLDGRARCQALTLAAEIIVG